MFNTRRGADAPASPFAQPVHTLSDLAHVLHTLAYEPCTQFRYQERAGAPGEIATYRALCGHINTIENTATDLQRMAAGLELALRALQGSAEGMGLDGRFTEGLRGLLQPLCAELERHAGELAAAVDAESRDA